ncbi:MAG: glutamate synthase-related protein [Thermodesulfobacteriota bacterium]
MPTIDLSQMNIKTANEVIKGYGATHRDVEIVNPDARHYIGVGLTNPIRLSIRGSAGYFCGGLSDGPRIEVEKNVSWGVGDNMLAGSIVVGGNASAIAGEALRGGDIVIRGNTGSRAGQVMKKGTLCCCGNASFMAGYMMYGGRLIILGDSGPRVGEDMAGGAIFVGGRVESLGNDARVVEPDPDEIESVMAFLDRYEIPFTGTFRKVVSAEKELKFANPEPKSKPVAFTRFSGGETGYWNEKVRQDIQVKSAIGRYRIRGYGAARPVPHFGDIAFKADLSRAGIDPAVADRVNLRTFIGGKHGARALDLSMPVMIAPMSFGAVSPRMKEALGIASRLSGISENTGEGGMYSVERAEARQLIAQCLSGRLGWNIHDMKRSDGLEIYISQGAKPGLGGQLMASKLTREIAEMRGIPSGMDLRSPSRHPDILGGDDLIMKVLEFREAVGWRLPVGLKLGGGRTRDDIKIALKDGLDFIELDGLQGGTGAAGSEVLEYVGIPTLSALMEALDGLSEIEAEGQMPIVLMGGVHSGVDIAKALALGASAVGIGTSMLIAGGCTGCMQCSSGACPLGIATQDPELVGRFNTPARALMMHRYLESIRWQLAAVADALDYGDIRGLSRNDLVALTPEAAEMTRLPYAPEYRDRLRTEAASESRSQTETGTANFSRRDRKLIQAMAKSEVEDGSAQREILSGFLAPRENPFPETRPAHLDDVVFLSAALTRLVIDPYREACSTKTRISRWIGMGESDQNGPFLDLEHPFLATGFDDAPVRVRQALARALAATGCGYVGRKPLSDANHPVWLQLVGEKELPHPEAAGLVYPIGNPFHPVKAERLHSDQLVGLAVSGSVLPKAIPYALERELDFLILDGTAGILSSDSELSTPPDLTVMRDAIRILREMNREEDIALIHFGGMRSGTDVAKALAINCRAAVFGTAMALAMGGNVENGRLAYPKNRTVEEMEKAAVNWIKGTVQETAIIARCTGKTNVHNLEPEDMRSITLATSKAFGIPLASGQVRREGF